eukprot:555370_1
MFFKAFVVTLVTIQSLHSNISDSSHTMDGIIGILLNRNWISFIDYTWKAYNESSCYTKTIDCYNNCTIQYGIRKLAYKHAIINGGNAYDNINAIFMSIVME